MSAITVDLGTTEPLEDDERWRVTSKYFPSKVGGKPAWLALKNLPSGDLLQCAACSQPLTFLLQVYAPLESIVTAFHRTLFIFCCNGKDCKEPTLRALRSQLARSNEFYHYDPPNYDLLNDDTDLIYPENFGTKTCSVCGCFADKKCAVCQRANYCCKAHQTFDWKVGGHKLFCSSEEPSRASRGTLLFPELEVVIEGEQSDSEDGSDEEAEDEGDIAEYQKALQKLNPKYQNENLDTYVENGEEEEDKSFLTFNRTIKKFPSQVVRYYRCDDKSVVLTPLWVSDKNQISGEKTNCSQCGSSRRLEFQVMPQLLNELGPSANVDFGTLAVYSCSNSCTPSESEPYVEELVVKQDFS